MKKAVFLHLFSSALLQVRSKMPGELRHWQWVSMGETRGGPVSVRIEATSDVGGYGAVAVSGFKKSRVFGVVFGYRSSIEAEKRALKDCRRKGGNDPRIKWSLRTTDLIILAKDESYCAFWSDCAVHG